MRAKGILTAVLAASVLLLAPGYEGARADQNHGHGHSHQPAYNGNGHGYGWWGQHLFGDRQQGGHAYGKRARYYYGDGLTHPDRKKLKRIRHRFDNERAFRRHLRQNKPHLFARYMDHNHKRQRHAAEHRRHGYSNDHRGHRAQRYVWYRGLTPRAP